ncbi:ribonuclease P protein component [Facklamia miroungae]|uniref:Ribonuclease P protein component n=1 Tax=Facklamia miroungae TaxID=120956 RepID=A0A1G7SZI5_9LACT|nr:ribonuclease P protein component [Facklamia miroungae]NKZ29494.1 ribonuclease P protein component [Facklamia miroungae]SDG27809.1 ribonuclease P protein component [Facklamia miroungae]
MKKEFRVKSDKDFQKVFHQGISTANRQLVIYTYAKPNQKHFRVGLSVGKKLGNAVVRNQIKRYLRQALHEIEPAILPQVDFLLIARKDICDKNLAQIKKSMIHVMKKANIINPSLIKELSGGRNEQ